MSKRKGNKEENKAKQPTSDASPDENLGFPLFGLSVRQKSPKEVLVCAGGGGGAGRTGIGNGFSIFRFTDSAAKGQPVFHLWRAHDTGEDSIGNLQFHPKEDLLACGTGKSCVTYSFASGEVLEEKRFQTDFAESEDSEQKVVAFNSEGKLMLTAGGDGKIRLWNWPDLSLHEEILGHTGEIYAAHFDPSNGSRFATASTSGDLSCKIWELEKSSTDTSEKESKEKDSGDRKDKDEKTKKTQKNKQKDGKTVHPLCKLTIPTPGGVNGMRFRGCRFSSDGKYLFAITAKAKSDSYLHKWDLSTGKVTPIKTVIAHSRRNGGCTSFAVSADDKYIACGSSEGEIALFKANSMSWIHRRRVHDFFVSKMEFPPTPSSHVISVSGDYTLKATKVEITRGFVSMYASWLYALALIVAMLAVLWKYFL